MQTMEFFEFLLGQGRPKARIAGFLKDGESLMEQIWLQLVIGGLPSQAVDDALGAFSADLGTEIADLPTAQSELAASFLPGEMSVDHVMNHLKTV